MSKCYTYNFLLWFDYSRNFFSFSCHISSDRILIVGSLKNHCRLKANEQNKINSQTLGKIFFYFLSIIFNKINYV